MRMLLTLLACAASISVGCANAPLPMGIWENAKHIDTWPTKITTADDSGGKPAHGILEIGQSGIKVNGEPCKIYEQKTFATDDDALKWLYSNKIDYTTFHTRAPVTFIDTECTTILLGSDGKLFFDLEGEFYKARRITKKTMKQTRN